MRSNVVYLQILGKGSGMKDGPHPVDIHVGKRVRLRRTMLGMSQVKLGEALGITFQQVQKYEKGVNRLSSSRLFDVARVLDVPITYFFDDMNGSGRSQPWPEAGEDHVGAGQRLAHRESLQLIQSYYKITNPTLRRKIFELVRTAAATSGEECGSSQS